MPSLKPRFTIIVDEEMMEKIDDFRFENRYPNRTAAALDLIRAGLEEMERRQKAQKKPSGKEGQ